MQTDVAQRLRRTNHYQEWLAMQKMLQHIREEELGENHNSPLPARELDTLVTLDHLIIMKRGGQVNRIEVVPVDWGDLRKMKEPCKG